MDLLFIAILVVISATYSMSETALTAVNRAAMFALAQDGNKRAAMVNRLRDKKEQLIGTILLGNTFVNSASGALITVKSVQSFGPEYGPLVAAFITTFVLLVFTEILPKTIAINHAERASLWLAPFLSLSMKILYPLVAAIQWIVSKVLKLFGVSLKKTANADAANDVLRGTIELHHHEGDMERSDRDMLGSILDLDERSVSEVMTHRSKVQSIDIDSEPEAIISAVIASTHSRLPLWKGQAENIIGVIHQKDLFRLLRQQKIGITREMIRRVAQKPWFVPESTTLDDQLTEFRTKRKHFACVVDEYGAWMGILTLEDIIEEIVGEIDDEHDPLEMAEVIPFGDFAYRVSGSVTIRDLNRQLDWDLPDENATTIAGLVLHEARVIPDKGATFGFFGYRFTIEEKRATQIMKLLVEKLEDAFDDAQE